MIIYQCDDRFCPPNLSSGDIRGEIAIPLAYVILFTGTNGQTQIARMGTDGDFSDQQWRGSAGSE